MHYILAINVVKMSILPETIYRFSVTIIKNATDIFSQNWKNNLKIHIEAKKTPNRKSNLK
jgi:hypothetical protein